MQFLIDDLPCFFRIASKAKVIRETNTKTILKAIHGFLECGIYLYCRCRRFYRELVDFTHENSPLRIRCT